MQPSARLNAGAAITNEVTKQKNGMGGSFHSFAVLDPAGKSTEELATAGIDALEAYIKEIGLPTTLSEMGISGEGADDMLRAVADSTIIIPSAPKVLDADEIYEILQEAK